MMLQHGLVHVANPSSVITMLELHTSHRSRLPDGLYTHSNAADGSASSAMNADSSRFHKSVLFLFLQGPAADRFLCVLLLLLLLLLLMWPSVGRAEVMMR
jgi:hypothetical protein